MKGLPMQSFHAASLQGRLGDLTRETAFADFSCSAAVNAEKEKL